MALSFFLLISCDFRSQEDFREEGEAVAKNLIKEFKKIRNREDLMGAEPHLKKIFNEFADLIIAVNAFEQKHPSIEILEINSSINEQLKEGFDRIFFIDGGREILEECQREAQEKLTRNFAKDS